MKIDPHTNRIEAVLRDGVQSLHRPGAISYDGSSLWQATSDQEHATPTGELLRRDPTTGAIQSTHTLDTGEGLGFAFGYAWIAHDLGPDRASLGKVDPASGKVLATLQLPGELADVNADARSLWYLSHQGDLVEIDPLTAKVVHTYSVAGSAVAPSRVVPLLGSVWICDCDHGQILKVDPATGAVTKTVTLQEKGYLIGVDSSDGKTLWLLDPAAGTITPLDPDTGDPGQPLGFGGGNVYDAQIGFGSIWVAAGSQLFRFDLATGSGIRSRSRQGRRREGSRSTRPTASCGSRTAAAPITEGPHDRRSGPDPQCEPQGPVQPGKLVGDQPSDRAGRRSSLEIVCRESQVGDGARTQPVRARAGPRSRSLGSYA